jgi:hypothetical protein
LERTNLKIDPVALQTQDFVDEWLTRPWAETESRSAVSGLDKTEKVARVSGGDFVAGELRFVQQCREQGDQ